MTESPFTAFLRQISPGRAGFAHPLVGTSIVIGRDPRCQIVLDSQLHGGVSRQHVKIFPSADSPSGWQICDLASANGTFVNGQRLQGGRNLREGDCITLAQGGPTFIFEFQVAIAAPDSFAPPPIGSFSPTHPNSHYHSADAVTFSQLFPIVSTGRDLTRKAYLIPGVLTVAFVVMMFLSVGNPVFFNLLLAIYLSGAAYYFVYQLCGKLKPWWLLFSTALMTMFLLISPALDLFIWIFREILPGSIPEDLGSESFPILFVRMFFGAGLMEELLKAVPIFVIYFVGTQLRSPEREQIGVWEPLDGILLGTASAVGFTLLETLGQYVPQIMSSTALQTSMGTAETLGVQLLVPRILGSIAGHMAYSGYFGYFIGLSVLKPRERWQILGVGYLTAASLHALWNATGIINFLVLAIVGMISYAFLAAAILKARALSPNRLQNFATRFTRLP